MSFPWNTTEYIFVCFGIILIIVLTVGGNLVVLFAFWHDPHLLTASNNFLLSMAIADLLVGLICMPFYSYAQLNNSWPFGKLFCKIWITIDDVATMASVLSIVAITIERYWSINHGIHYRRHTTKTRIRMFSALIWLIPFINFAPGIWLLEPSEDTNIVVSLNNITKIECIGAYHTHTLYLIIAQINFFAWPLIVIIVLNVLIVVNLYKRSHRFPAFGSFRVPETKQQQLQRSNSLREQYPERNEEEEEEEEGEGRGKQQQQQQLQLQQSQQIDTNVQTMTVVKETNCCLLNRTDFEHRHSSSSDRKSPSIKGPNETSIENGSIEFPSNLILESNSKQSVNIYSRFKQTFLSPSARSEPLTTERRVSKIEQKPAHSSILVWNGNPVRGIASELQLLPIATTNHTGEQRTVRRLRRDKRAATSLFTLVLVFMIFLLPYVFVVVVGRIFSLEILTNTTGQVYLSSFWLLWLNSTVNPILYPFIQPRFRAAYRRLFYRFIRRRRGLASLIADLQRGK